MSADPLTMLSELVHEVKELGELVHEVEELRGRVVKLERVGAPPSTGELEWLPVKAAAARLSCSEQAVYKRVKRGTLMSRRNGRRLYVNGRQVATLAASREIV